MGDLLPLPSLFLAPPASASLPSTGRNSFYMGTCQDEPEQLDDWNRIAELQQRNRVCPPHLKTCYPLESRVSLAVICTGPTLAPLLLPWQSPPVLPADPALVACCRVTLCSWWNSWQSGGSG